MTDVALGRDGAKDDELTSPAPGSGKPDTSARGSNFERAPGMYLSDRCAPVLEDDYNGDWF